MKRNLILALILVLGIGIFAYASTEWRMVVSRMGLTAGDLIYARNTKELTNLTAGPTGTVVQSTGVALAPAYVAKNTFRAATIKNFATLAVSWTLSEDEQLCFLLATTNANAANTIAAPATAGKVFFLRNGSGQNTTIHYSSGTGVTLATATAAMVIYDSTVGDYVKLGTQVVSP